MPAVISTQGPFEGRAAFQRERAQVVAPILSVVGIVATKIAVVLVLILILILVTQRMLFVEH